MHVNREIVDQVCAAALVLLTLRVAERPSKRLAALLGVVTGLAMLGNTRLVFIPILCAALPRLEAAAHARHGRRRGPRPRRGGGRRDALARPQRGRTSAAWRSRPTAARCGRRTTRRRTRCSPPASGSTTWRRNSPRPAPPNQLTPEDAYGYYTKPGVGLQYAVAHYPNECVEMSFYEHLAAQYVKHHPGGKAKLAALSEQLLWQPNVFETTGRNGAGHAARRRPPHRRARLHVGALRARRRRALPRPARVRRARAAPVRLSVRVRGRCSSARRATGSPGTSCSRCSPPRRSSERYSACAPDESRPRAPDAGDRRLRAAPAHAAARARRARHRAAVRRARRSRLGPGRLLRRAPRARRCASGRRATSIRCCSHGSCARSTPTSCTRISCTPTSTAASRRSSAARASSRRSTTTIPSAPARSGSSSGGSRGSPTGS